MSSTKRIPIDLTSDERTLLTFGLLDWGGPAEPTQAVARALGFVDIDDLLAEGKRIALAIRAHDALDVTDWTRALASASVIFGSDLLGIGDEWTAIHGHNDEHWLSTLRRLYVKLPTDRACLGQ